jgi:hypothetical protein
LAGLYGGYPRGSFNGKPAEFKVVSDTFLAATVPLGATTGFITVTTQKGTLTSNEKFQIIHGRGEGKDVDHEDRKAEFVLPAGSEKNHEGYRSRRTAICAARFLRSLQQRDHAKDARGPGPALSKNFII